MSLSLLNREWKSFFISGEEGIFTIAATKSGIDKNKLNPEGTKSTPYITRSDKNNSLDIFVSDVQRGKVATDGPNVITIGLDTQSVAYQPYSFYTGQNVQILTFPELTKETALFVIPLIKVQMQKFCWGTGATLGRLERTRIMLPICPDGTPDWDFMQSYIENKLSVMLETYLKFKSKF